jgi:hypothetical protein
MDPARRDARREKLLAVVRAENTQQAPGQVLTARSAVPTRRHVLVAASLLALGAVGAGGVVAIRGGSQDGSRTTLAATPASLHYQLAASPESAGDVLRHLADVAAAQPLPVDHPPVRYTASSAWYLHSRVSGKDITSKVVPATERMWTREDGSGLLVRTIGGQQDRIDIAARQSYDVRHLPTDTASLPKALGAANTLTHGPVGYLEVIKDIWLVEAPTPKVQAALLRSLAPQPGLRLRGDVVDRLGSRGVAVSVDSSYAGLPTRYTLIVDPATGMLLGYEEELTETAGLLNVPVPSVIGYQAWSATAWADAVPQM